MVTTEKFPDDIENTIYEILLSASDSPNGISISDVSQVILQKQIKIEPEKIYMFVQRMCNEGMAEKIDENYYRGVKFDPYYNI
jgi:hypothetical protein